MCAIGQSRRRTGTADGIPSTGTGSSWRLWWEFDRPIATNPTRVPARRNGHARECEQLFHASFAARGALGRRRVGTQQAVFAALHCHRRIERARPSHGVSACYTTADRDVPVVHTPSPRITTTSVA
jgi:hypothetical protein